jgi:pimeloyl-ACP methyl ester carboxylesterase
MLQPSPEIQKRLDTYQTISSREAAAVEHEWHHERIPQKFWRATIATAAIFGALTSGYINDIRANKLIQAASSVGLEFKGDAAEIENSHHANIFIDGFGKKNADILTHNLGEAIGSVTDGQQWSINFDDAPLRPNDIAQLIIETAHERGVDSVTLVGHSAGGNIAIQTVVDILQESDIAVPLIYFDLSPDGIEGLQDVQRQNLGALEWITQYVPDVEYSTPARAIGEFALRLEIDHTKNLIENIENIVETAAGANSRISNGSLPGGWLMLDQVRAITDTNIEAEFSTIAGMPKDIARPTVVYLSTVKPGYDPIVDVEKSSEEIGIAAINADLPFLSYDIAGALHTKLDAARAEYLSVLSNAKDPILNSIDQQIALAEHYSKIYELPGPFLR